MSKCKHCSTSITKHGNLWKDNSHVLPEYCINSTTFCHEPESSKTTIPGMLSYKEAISELGRYANMLHENDPVAMIHIRITGIEALLRLIKLYNKQ